MNDYELLGLMDTHKALKQQQIQVPETFAEFITNLTPINDGAIHSRRGPQSTSPEGPGSREEGG